MKFDESYFRSLNDRLLRMKRLTQEPIPAELAQQYNVKDMQQVLHTTWVAPIVKRPFTPMIKQMAPHDIITISSPYSSAEKQYIIELAHVIRDAYGSPQFTYKGDLSEDNLRVKQWQSLLLVSPKVTAGSHKRRWEALQKYFTDQKFSPDLKILEKAVNLLLTHLSIEPSNTAFEPKYVKGLFAAHSSNVGFPFFKNETRIKDGKTYRDITVELTKRLNDLYGARWMASIPAMIIGRDQPGGMDIDPSSITTWNQLMDALRTARYKPSKARPVWGIARVVNNNIAPIVHAIIHGKQFLETPEFCGFKDRSVRYPLYQKFYDTCDILQLIPLNVDFESFDTSIPRELLLIAHDVLFQWVKLHNAPADLTDSVIATAIYTRYIAQNPESKRIVAGYKSKAIASGIATTGLSGFICAAIVMLYALIIKYGETYVINILKKFKEKGTFAWAGLGDDFLTAIRKFSDINDIAKIVERDFGMVISVSSLKTAVGVDFLQEHYYNGTISYPIGRVWRSLLYTERAKGLGPYQWVMTYFNIVNNMRDNDSNTINETYLEIIKYDKTRLGRVNAKTAEPMNINTFMHNLKQELMEQNLTAKTALWDGDPSKEHVYTESGDIKSDYVKKCFQQSQWAYEHWIKTSNRSIRKE